MKVTEIVVTAGRTFNHPHEQYSNLKPSVVLKAALAYGEDPLTATKILQAQAEGLVEDHKQHLLKSIEELYQLGERQEEIRGLQRQLTSAQERLDTIRKQHPDLLALPAPEASNQIEEKDVIF